MILLRDLIGKGQIKTTHTKAKIIQSMVEKLITHAKKGTNSSVLQMEKVLADKVSVATLRDWAKTRFSTRTSGYTRVVRVGTRVGDNAEESLLMFVDPLVVAEVVSSPKKKTEKKETVKEVTEPKTEEKKEKKTGKATKKAGATK